MGSFTDWIVCVCVGIGSIAAFVAFSAVADVSTRKLELTEICKSHDMVVHGKECISNDGRIFVVKKQTTTVLEPYNPRP